MIPEISEINFETIECFEKILKPKKKSNQLRTETH